MKVLQQGDLMEDFRGLVEKYGRRCGEKLRLSEGKLGEGQLREEVKVDGKAEGKGEVVGC